MRRITLGHIAAKGKALDRRFQVLLGADGKPERVRVRRGTHFSVGDALGTINPMAHVHMEYYPGGVAVNAVLPGIIDTLPNRAAMPDADYSAWTAPAAIADVIWFLASPKARAINGALVPVTAAAQD